MFVLDPLYRVLMTRCIPGEIDVKAFWLLIGSCYCYATAEVVVNVGKLCVIVAMAAFFVIVSGTSYLLEME